MKRPIGVFDSGVGGLTVLKSLMKHFPDEDFIYLGDTARVPYGIRSSDTVIRYSRENTDFLLKYNIKMLVVACNTASSVAIPEISSRVDIPVVGVVRPAAVEAFRRSGSKKIGVIGTGRTIRSGAYEESLKEISDEIIVKGVSCPLFVPLVEEGWIDNQIVRDIAKIYFKELRETEIDVLILGCTHYPLIRNVLQEQMGEKVILIESGEATAKEVGRLLKKYDIIDENLNSKRKVTFFVTDDEKGFDEVATGFMPDYSIKSERVLI